MKKRIEVRRLALVALLAGLMVLFGLLPSVFFIPTPWGVQVTLMCLPVIIGTLVLGLRTGFYLGIIFAITSLAQLFLYPSAILAPLFYSPQAWFEPLLVILIIFVPRMAIGPITHLVSIGLKTKYGKLNLGIACALGSLTNTVGFLGMLYLLFGQRIGEIVASIGLPYNSGGAFILFLGVSNGLSEAAVAVVACIPIVLALKKSYKLETGEKSE
jgi:uncharacterized membrane protein